MGIGCGGSGGGGWGGGGGRKRPLLQIRHKKMSTCTVFIADPQLPQFDMSKSQIKMNLVVRGLGEGG